MSVMAATCRLLLWRRNVLCVSRSAEGLWRPARVPGRRHQGDCWRERSRQRLRSSQPAWQIHQCALLHTVDLQGLQILPQPSDCLETQKINTLQPRDSVEARASASVNPAVHSGPAVCVYTYSPQINRTHSLQYKRTKREVLWCKIFRHH